MEVKTDGYKSRPTTRQESPRARAKGAAPVDLGPRHRAKGTGFVWRASLRGRTCHGTRPSGILDWMEMDG